MKNQLTKIFPLADQIGVSAFNFLLVFIPSLVLGTTEFVKFSNIALFVLFIINASNAVVYQPYLRFFRKEIWLNSLIIKNICITLFMLLSIFLIFVLITKESYNFSSKLAFYSAIWIILMFICELIKRYNMLVNKWNLNFYIIISINILTFLGILIFQPSKAENILLIIDFSLGIILIILFLVKNTYFKFLFLKKRSKNNVVSSKEFWLFGKNLFGGATAFWFISGGYLLLIGHFLNDTEIGNIRVIQNFFSGSLIIINTLDNYLLAKNENFNVVFNKYKKLRFLILIFLAFYSCCVAVAIHIFYPTNNISLFLVTMFSLFYIILSNLRLINSISKTVGSSKDVFISQFLACLIYLICIVLISIAGFKVSSYSLIAIWVPGLLLGYVYSILNLKSIRKNYKMLSK